MKERGLKEKILELKSKNLSHKNIAELLSCSISTVSYHCKGVNFNYNSKKIVKSVVDKIQEYYYDHSLKETAEKFNISHTTVLKYTKNKRVKLSDEERKENRKKAVIKRRRKLKRILVKYKGGCCQKCGYDKSYSALQFHHRDPLEKSFGLSQKGLTKSLNKLKLEADKCDLLCANCHAELHGEQ